MQPCTDGASRCKTVLIMRGTENRWHKNVSERIRSPRMMPSYVRATYSGRASRDVCPASTGVWWCQIYVCHCAKITNRMLLAEETQSGHNAPLTFGFQTLRTSSLLNFITWPTAGQVVGPGATTCMQVGTERLQPRYRATTRRVKDLWDPECMLHLW